MKKYFIYAVMALASLSFVACNKDKNDAETPETSETNNPYPYLRVDDLMPLYMLPIGQAEEMINQIGYKGGWQQKGNEAYYLYVSKSKKDSIILYVDLEGRYMGKGLVYTISYQASKGVTPSNAKGWLAHNPENIKLPARVSKLTGKQELPFLYALTNYPPLEEKEGDEIYSTYTEYKTGIKNLSSGMQTIAIWGSAGVPNNAPTGYYGGIQMLYDYINGKDRAILMLYGFYHEYNDNEPIPADE